MTYKRKTPPVIPDEQRQLLEYVLTELEAVERAADVSDFLRLKTWYEEPAKRKEGLVVLADGTEWNPGSGAGVYAYYAGSWKKLG